MPLTPGHVLNGRYRIARLLGQGGFGAVYRAWDLNLEQACAVKENTESSPAARRQFLVEAKIASRLRHPNLPVVIDHFILPGQGQYLVMDFIEGEDLQARLDRAGGPLPEAQVVDWIAQVSAALAYLHAQVPPVVHRDVKPKNIIVTPQGQAMLVDFGISKVFDPGTSTTAGARAVTAGYSPVEQYGGGTTGPYSDVYALGATLYALLTGVVPPPATDLVAGHAVLAPVADLNASLSPYLNTVIATAMQAESRRRYPDAAAFRAALLAAGAASIGPVPAATQPAAPGPTAGPAASRRGVWLRGGWLFAAGAGVLALVLAGRLMVNAQKDRRAAAQTAQALTALPADIPTITPAPTRPPNRAPTLTPVPTRPPDREPSLTPTPTITVTPSITPTATAEPGPVVTRVAPADGMVQVYVPAGEFRMGSTDVDGRALAAEKPQHPVYLDAFWIDRTEVTNNQYARCVEAGACQAPEQASSATRSSYYGDPQYADYPVIWVSWEDAQAYCAWAGRELPTEAQWEKAARGADGRLYPWGDAPPNCSLANSAIEATSRRCVGDTRPAGSLSQGASPYGALDMAGNVLEWVADWYDEGYYHRSPVENPTGPASGSQRVLRGGGWLYYWNYLRSAYRNINTPTDRYNYVGFRCGSPPGK